MTKKQRAVVSVILVALFAIGCMISSFFGRFELALVFAVATITVYCATMLWMRRGAQNEPPRPT